jgi:hypothetical protein
LGLLGSHSEYGYLARSRGPTCFRVNQDPVTSIIQAMSDMEHGFFPRIIDRAVANARVIRGAPEAVALMGIITLGVSYFAFQHFHGESVAALNDRISDQTERGGSGCG